MLSGSWYCAKEKWKRLRENVFAEATILISYGSISGTYVVTSGCSDNSIGKHATKHSRTTGHYVIRSFEPGEDWRYWYADAASEE